MKTKKQTYLIPDFDLFDKERFQRKLETNWLIKRQFYSDQFRPLQCRCITGNCRHHTGKCIPKETCGECGGEVVRFKYSRGGFGVSPA